MVLQASINKALAAGTRVHEYIRWEPVVAIRGGVQPATLTGATVADLTHRGELTAHSVARRCQRFD